jgi:purine-cytosine permease-like protein
LHSTGLIIAFTASIVVNTKNGVGISLLLAIFFFGYLLLSFFRNLKTSLSLLAPILIVLTIGFFVWKKHSANASPGWETIIQDIKISIQVDKYHNWQNTYKFGMPLNELNQPVAWNTYERFAWASKGVDLIVKYPLGYGTLTHQSFPNTLEPDPQEQMYGCSQIQGR